MSADAQQRQPARLQQVEGPLEVLSQLGDGGAHCLVHARDQLDHRRQVLAADGAVDGVLDLAEDDLGLGHLLQRGRVDDRQFPLDADGRLA
jgi:hypothetical protein